MIVKAQEAAKVMKVIRLIMGFFLGGCWGYAIAEFAKRRDWAMVAFIIGLLFAVFSLVSWIVEAHQGKERQ